MTTLSATTSSASRRYIYDDADMEAWKTSPLKQDLLRVVGAMGKSCASSSCDYRYYPQQPLRGLSPAMASLHGSLTQMLCWLEDDIPPLEESSISIRFGNPAFRSWHARLQQRSRAILRAMYLAHSTADGVVSLETAAQRGYQAAAATNHDTNNSSTVLPLVSEGVDPPFLEELSSYLHSAFGHPIRLDYGTGHESSFMVLLYAACKLGWMDETTTTSKQTTQPPSMEKLKATTIAIFHAYLRVTRQLQMKYRLEPAGSHGVWGLDDYHCLPFYFGACQCQALNDNNMADDDHGQPMPQPKDITDDHCRKRFCHSLLYFGCINYICTLKRGAPFFECSPMLYDISQTCPTWSKVAQGLLKLYEGEVLNKRQVVQHFTFGQHLFVATWKPSQASPPQPPSTNFRTTPGTTCTTTTTKENTSSSSTTSGVGFSSDDMMGRAPWATTTDTAKSTTRRSHHHEQQVDSDSGAGSDHPTMPPPTKAPWAK